MARIQLPERFNDRLSGSRFAGAVNFAIDRCCDFYGDPTRGLRLFPEYTDHGVTHFQRVLDAAAELLTLETESLLTVEDFAVLTIAVLLHDAAMHTTPEGFLALIDHARPGPLIPALDPRSWAEEWEGFLDEASRWDGRRLRSVLGDASVPPDREAEDLACFIRSPAEMGSPDRWPVTYCKLVGEFVRQHHPRIAHEFALQGVPGASVSDPFRLVEVGNGLDDLCGLVARSHGIGLRDTFDYLRDKYYGLSLCRNIHAPFLMVLLRIGDYIQVDASRAPAASLRVRSLRNPVSIGEWSAHRSIVDVREDEQDQEAILVVAKPPDNSTYLRLRSLLNGLQRELDTSWAVLGEVYSRQGDLRRLGIRLRRVRSNLDDLRMFRQEIDFIPGRFAFESAGTDLLKKLIAPLYGDSPEVGIRELLQNAIDAVNERHAKSTPKEVVASAIGVDPPEVFVRVEGSAEDGGWVIVEDRGVGMTEDILRFYFLRVGASYRDSDAWRKAYTVGGSSVIVRSGRFGLGSLAAFLLGERIEVVTRHVHSEKDEALAFTASIEDLAIEVHKTGRDHCGTTIRVKIDGRTFARLSEHDGVEWDWYRWPSPRVDRTINGRSLPSLTRVPQPGEDLDLEWHRLLGTNFDDVVWTYGRAPNVVCNGLNVGSKASSRGYLVRMHWEGESFPHDISIPLKVPCVTVVDRSAHLPLDLQRFRLVNHYHPFVGELLSDATRDYCAFCLTFAPNLPPWQVDGGVSDWPDYPGSETNNPSQFFIRLPTWFYTDDGWGASHWANLMNFRPSSVLFLIAVGPSYPKPKRPIEPGQAVFLASLDLHFASTALPTAMGVIFCRDRKDLSLNTRFFTRKEGAAVLFPRDFAQTIEGFQSDQIDLSGIIRTALSNDADGESDAIPIVIWEEGSAPSLSADPSEDLLLDVASGEMIVALLNSPRLGLTPPTSSFTQVWNELMPDPIIPYDPELRRHRFANAYRELDQYIRKWEGLRNHGPAEIRRRFHRETRIQEAL
jgi:molecular chaperone HtpG